MRIFSRIAYLILLLLVLLVIPSIRAQNTSNQILYAVADENRNFTISTVNVDDGLKTQVGVIHNFGSEAGWSPDGKFIYLFDYAEADYASLTLIDADTNRSQTIPDPLEKYVCGLPIFWSPNGEWVAYTTQADPKPLRKIYNPRTGDVQTLKDANKPYDQMLWSPDSRYLVYRTTFQETRYKISIWDVQKQQIVTVLDIGTSEYPLWSPTENRLAFADANSPDIIIYNVADGTKQHYEGGHIGSWSPDGHFLALYRRDKNQRNFIIDVRANPQDAFDDEIGTIGVNSDAAWSTDGRYLAMATFDADNGSKGTIYIVDVVTRSSQRLKIDPLDYDKFIWSPVGNKLIFAANPEVFNGIPAFTSLWMFDIDSNKSSEYSARISIVSYEHALHWSGTGLYITIDTGSEVVLMNSATGRMNIINTGDQTFSQSYWSPDGKKVVLTSDSSTSGDIYVFEPESKILKDIADTTEARFLGWRGGKKANYLSDCGAT